ncbi:hypothetical protein IMZ11_25515 [Microtetraspora sp. AC03309]|uniref:hypothetical protein n=1 Tax=Microtetraspora sp. AC03309 TaxID=2779376 RepID=UPI001E2A28DD|nr:hypothetical protein [Microtetraspora sp. AC03309]MCC5578989.1 hypothetical protein [Microtetraspora sp. AC03309]
MKRVMWGCALAIVVPLAALFVLIMIPVWRDDARLDALYKRASTYPLPPKTRHYFFDDDMLFGKNMTGGSGDYCDYRIRITLETALTAEEIRNYYGKARIAGAEGKADISLWFEDLDESGLRRVIVQVFDSHGSDWDWRCT